MKNFEKMIELDNKQLKKITAGQNRLTYHVKTSMRCRLCGYWDTWEGDYMRKPPYECPSCGKYAFYGEQNY